jgi:myo-inositol-1(or 4)-monophosphatase
MTELQNQEQMQQLDQELLDRAMTVALNLAHEAGALLREKLNLPRSVTHKGQVDLVTDADQASEVILASGLREAFPDHRLIGEEGSRGSVDSPYGWVIDPLDGTTNYAHRYPHFAVSIGLEFRGEPVLGVVYDPMREEVFQAIRGRGALLNDKPIAVSTIDTLIDALLATGFSYQIEERRNSYVLWNVINNTAQGVRRDGSAALNMCYVAAGRLEGFYELPVNAWDIGAGAVIVREAGGIVTNYNGSAFGLYDRQVVATNGHIQDQLIAGIRETLATIAAD